jgi:hypothetical protein
MNCISVFLLCELVVFLVVAELDDFLLELIIMCQDLLLLLHQVLDVVLAVLLEVLPLDFLFFKSF